MVQPVKTGWPRKRTVSLETFSVVTLLTHWSGTNTIMSPCNKQALAQLIDNEGWESLLRRTFAMAVTRGSELDMEAERLQESADPSQAPLADIAHQKAQLLTLMAEALEPCVKLAIRIERLREPLFGGRPGGFI